jgi:primosomal protein N'
MTQYPPYTYLVLIELSASDFSLVTETSVSLSQLLEEKMNGLATVIGPNIPYPE